MRKVLLLVLLLAILEVALTTIANPCNDHRVRSYRNSEDKCYTFFRCVSGKPKLEFCPRWTSYPVGINKRCVGFLDCNHDDLCVYHLVHSYKRKAQCYEYYKCVNGTGLIRACPDGTSYQMGVNNGCEKDPNCIGTSIMAAQGPCIDTRVHSYRRRSSRVCYKFFKCVDGFPKKAFCPRFMSYPQGINKRCELDLSCRRYRWGWHG